MLILIFLLISQILTFKVKWDGRKDGIPQTYKLENLKDKMFIWESKNHNTTQEYLPVPLAISNILLVKNAKILKANASNYVPNGNIIKFYVRDKPFIYAAVVYDETNYFQNFIYQTCQIAHCENGLTLIPKEQQTVIIFGKDGYKFIEIIYVKYITEDMNLKLYVFTISGDDFPLVICPYKGWVSIYSGTEFIPYEETNGIMFDQFRHRHILLPAYPRNEDTDVFVCGSIKYKDGSQLTISYIMELDNYYVIKSNEPTNDFEDIWKCSDTNIISHNYYFVYSKNDKILNKMKYIKYNSRDSTKFYYNDIMYIYENNRELKEFQKNGYYAHGDIIKFTNIKPLCKRTLPQLKFKLKLVSPDGDNIFYSKNETDILNVSEDMLNKELNYKCKIFVEEASSHSFLSNYYDDVMEVSLVSKDEDGNKIFHDTIEFKDNFDGFKKYECEIRLKDNKFRYKYAIENLSFIPIPSNISLTNQNEEWRVKEDVVIQCQKRLSNIGKIHSIKVEISENFFVTYSNLTSNGVFNIEGDYVRANYENLIKSQGRNNNNVKRLTTICVYKVMGERIISIVKSGTVLQKTIFTKKANKSDQMKKNRNKEVIIGLSVGILIIILAIIIAITTIFVVRCLNKRRRKQSNLSTSSSFSSYSNSSMSGSLMSGSGLSAPSIKKSQTKVSGVNK
uniref:6-cysteine protein n=1 Tax=Strongyloides venezuelensis TaxID=75913 RepID=A0A0K0FG53_STRVS